MYLDKEAVAELIRDPDTLATTLHVILLAAYGTDVYTEDVLELYLRLEEDFHARITEEGENRINAIRLATETDAFYDDLTAFQAICNALYGGDIGDPISSAFDEVTVPELLWATYEVGLNRDDDPEFSRSIEQFIDQVIAEEVEDVDIEVNEIDEASDLLRLPYTDQFIADMKSDLRRQLSKLGITEADLRPLASE